MKILIITGTAGGGHNVAAKSLQEEIIRHGHSCLIKDLFQKNETTKKISFEKIHLTILNYIPSLYRCLYYLTNNRYLNKFFKRLFFYRIFEIKDIIEKNEIDCIVSTMPVSVSIISLIKKFFIKDIFYMQVVTDFKAHHVYIDKRVDSYIVGSEYTKEYLVKEKIQEDKIHVLGIPISSEFKPKTNNDINNKFNILIMGGTMGFKGIEDIIVALLQLNAKFRLTVVCGKNEKLKAKLDSRFHDVKHLEILGFCDYIPELMRKSHILVSKPGGLTTTEAIATNLPIIVPYAIPGQEEDNVDFLLRNEMGVFVKDISGLKDKVNELTNDVEKYNNMVYNMKKLSGQYNIKEIVSILEKNRKE